MQPANVNANFSYVLLEFNLRGMGKVSFLRCMRNKSPVAKWLWRLHLHGGDPGSIPGWANFFSYSSFIRILLGTNSYSIVASPTKNMQV